MQCVLLLVPRPRTSAECSACCCWCVRAAGSHSCSVAVGGAAPVAAGSAPCRVWSHLVDFAEKRVNLYSIYALHGCEYCA